MLNRGKERKGSLFTDHLSEGGHSRGLVRDTERTSRWYEDRIPGAPIPSFSPSPPLSLTVCHVDLIFQVILDGGWTRETLDGEETLRVMGRH